MSVSSNLTVFGPLTGSGTKDLIHTAAGTEYVAITFFNRNASSRTLSIWLGGNGNDNQILDAALLVTKGTCVLEVKLALNDTIYAEGSAATSINVIKEVDSLT